MRGGGAGTCHAAWAGRWRPSTAGCAWWSSPSFPRSLIGQRITSGSGRCRMSCWRTWLRRSWCSGRPGSCCAAVFRSGYRARTGRGDVPARGGWHLPALYDGALRHPAEYAAEVVSYLGLGVAFWLQLIGSRPLSPAWAPLRRVALLAGTVIVSTLLGMVIVFGYGVAYPGYAGPGHRVV